MTRNNLMLLAASVALLYTVLPGFLKFVGKSFDVEAIRFIFG